MRLIRSFATPSWCQQAAAMAIEALPLVPETSDSYRGRDAIYSLFDIFSALQAWRRMRGRSRQEMDRFSALPGRRFRTQRSLYVQLI